MGPRQIIANVKQIAPHLLTAILIVGVAAAAIWLLPNRTAAIILGLLTAIALSHFVIRSLQRNVQIAILWLSIGVVADAAYARLNDQAPLTVANLLVSLAESLVKLVDILIRSIGIAGPNIRAQLAAVTPDFVWALILTSTLLLIFTLTGRNRNSGAKPELRRAA